MARRGNNATTRGFLKSVNAWTKATEERSLDAFQEGSKDFYDLLVSVTPRDTGHLRGSLVATVNGSDVAAFPTNIDISEGSGRAESYMNIDRAKLGDRITYSYRAIYWKRVNYGFVGRDRLGRYFSQAGQFFVEKAGSQYRSVMRAAATALRMKMK